MTATIAERARVYLEAANTAHAIEWSGLAEADRLEDLKTVIRGLASRADLFPAEAFPRAPGSPGGLFRLVQPQDGRAALYVSLGYTGRKQDAPHAHASWALVAGVSGGVETNRIYERTDDGSVPDQGHLALKEEVAVGPGDVVTLPSGGFHTIEVVSDTPVLHIHAYGRAVETPGLRIPQFDAPDASSISWRVSGAFRPPLAVVDLDQARAEAKDGQIAVILADAGQATFKGPFVARSDSAGAGLALAALDAPADIAVVVVGSEEIAGPLASQLYADGRAVVFRAEPLGH